MTVRAAARFSSAALLLAVCLAASAGAAATRSEADGGSLIEELGWIRVTSEPTGLVVLVDGDSVGCTPLPDAAIEPGLHTVGVLPRGRRSFSTKPVVRQVEIRPGETAEVFLRYPRTVNITSTPFGASAFLNERFVGRTPFLFELPEQPGGTLELRLAGHETARVPVDLLQTVGAHWSAILAANATGAPLGPARVERGGWPWWRYGLLAGAGAGAILGVRLKMEADEAYGNYRSSGNLERQRELYDRAARYDDYSLAAWVVSETLLSTAAVLIIRDQILGHRRKAPAKEVR